MNLNSNNGLNNMFGNNSLSSSINKNKGNNFFDNLNNLNNEINNINKAINSNNKTKLPNDLSDIIAGFLDYSFSIWWFIIYALIFIIFLF